MEQSVTSLSNLFTLYLSRSDLAESSVAVKSRALRYFIALFGDMVVEQITYGHAEDFRNWLRKGRSKQSANIYVKNFKPFFVWLVKRAYIRSNPFDELQLFRVGRKKRRVYESLGIERMMKVADVRWRAMICLALCSLRRAEVLNLVVRDIHWDKGYILISPKVDTEFTWLWDIKNHNQAIVPLPETMRFCDTTVNLHRLLIELIDWLPPRQPYIFLPPTLYQKLLARKNRGELGFDLRNNPWGNFSRDFRIVCKRAAVEPGRFHDLRGTFANKMKTNGCSLDETQRLMRHASINTTVEYYIQSDEQELVAKSASICEKCYT